VQILETRAAKIVLLACIPLLFLPKVNLIAIGGANAGVRIDDLILLAVAAILLLAHAINRHQMGLIDRIVLLLTLSGLLSVAISMVLRKLDQHRLDASPFFAIRIVEYFVFLYVGRIAVKFISLPRTIFFLFGINVCVMVLQMMGLVGAFFVTGYMPSVYGRAMGLCAHSNEMALLLNMMLAYLLFATEPRSMTVVTGRGYLRMDSHLLLLLLGMVLVVATGSRIALIGLLVLVAAKLRQTGLHRHPVAIVLLLPVLVLGGTVVVLAGDQIDLVQRSLHLFSMKNLEMIPSAYQAIDIEQMDFLEAASVNLSVNADYDMSWFMRLRKWLFILKCYVGHPECWFQGLGPGVCGSCLDGSYLRILTENGLIGFSLYGIFFFSIARLCRPMRWVVVVYLINMLFIDSYISYKPMILLFFLTGYELAASEQTREMVPCPIL
jgi:hypothetical protein